MRADKYSMRDLSKTLFSKLKLFKYTFLMVLLCSCGGTTSNEQSDGSGSGGSGSASDFNESQGFVVMETESSRLSGDWDFENELEGFTGSGYYEFQGNNICSGPANDSIEFNFKINQTGTYELRLRGAKVAHCVAWKTPEDHASDTSTSGCNHEHGTCNSLTLPVRASGGGLECPDPTTQCLRQDISNDVFVSILNSSREYVGFNSQPANTLGDPIKLFGGRVFEWAWTGQKALDVSHQKWNARWNLPPGNYTLVIHGRSREFKIDRVVLFDTSRGNINEALNMTETR